MGTGFIRYADDLGTLVAALLAALACLHAGRRKTGRPRTSWLLLSAASFAWAFGEAVWAVYDLALGQEVPVPSYADVGYLGAIPLALAALVTHSGQVSDRRDRLRASLDAGILATSLLFLAWVFVLGTVWQQNDVATAEGLVTFAYPFGDVLVVFLLIRALRWLNGPDRLAFGWILGGLLAMSLSDGAYTYLTAVRGYETGNVIDLGWIFAYLGIAAGGWCARRESATNPSYRSEAGTGPAAILTPFLPLLLALGVLTVKAQLGRPVDRTTLVLAFVLTGSVLLRQVLTLLAPEPRSGRRRDVEMSAS